MRIRCFFNAVMIITIFFFIFPVQGTGAEKPVKARWTLMFFISGGNNYDPYGDKSVARMKTIGSTSDVNVVVLQDHLTKKAQKLYIRKGSADILEEYEKIDTGDYKELVKFVKWAVENYPADRYMVSLWQPGGGLGGGCRPVHICVDNISGNGIAAVELGIALKQIKEFTGRKLDILGMDCNQAQKLENCYEVMDYVDYAVSSEEAVTPNGWPYDLILGGITKDPNMKPAVLASFIVNAYYRKYSAGNEIITQSAIDCSRLGAVREKLDAMADALIGKLGDKNVKTAIDKAARDVQTYCDESRCDIVDFCRRLNAGIRDEKINQAANEVIESVVSGPSKLVIENKTFGDQVKDSNGVTIYIPRHTPKDRYFKTAFGKTKWSDFIKKYGY